MVGVTKIQALELLGPDFNTYHSKVYSLSTDFGVYILIALLFIWGKNMNSLHYSRWSRHQGKLTWSIKGIFFATALSYFSHSLYCLQLPHTLTYALFLHTYTINPTLSLNHALFHVFLLLINFKLWLFKK